MWTPPTSLGGRKWDKHRSAKGHRSAWETEPRWEQFAPFPVQGFLNWLRLWGSHGLTQGGAPKAGSRWELELLPSLAGRRWSGGRGLGSACCIPRHLGGRTWELTSNLTCEAGAQVTRLLLCSEGARLGSGPPDAEWGWAAEPSLLTS